MSMCEAREIHDWDRTCRLTYTIRSLLDKNAKPEDGHPYPVKRKRKKGSFKQQLHAMKHAIGNLKLTTKKRPDAIPKTREDHP